MRFSEKDLNNYTLEINVANKCNLNCSNCDHFAPLGDDKFLTPEEIIKQLNILTNKLPFLSRIILLGGEPLLNPHLFDICKSIREQYNEINIDVLTNGILLKNWDLKQYQDFKDINIHFGITKYPDIDYSFLPEIDNIHYLSSRFLFQSMRVNVNAYENIEHYYGCVKNNSVGLILKDYKIYQCPFSAFSCFFFDKYNIPITEREGIDYLDINTITYDKMKKFINTPKSYCKYCSTEYNYSFWHQLKNDDKYLEYSQSIRSQFLTNYDKFYKRFVDSSLYYKFKESGLYENIDRIYAERALQTYLNRFENSKIDIIIPYHKVTKQLTEQLMKTLSNQTFIKNCTIYLISDDSKQASLIFDNFFYKGLNCVLLKSDKRQGAGMTRNIGIEESHGEYLFFLDYDDTLNNIDDLQYYYEEAVKNSFPDIIASAGISDTHFENGYKKGIRPILIKNSYLKSKNIRYNNLYFNEDALFFSKVLLNTDKILILDKVIYNYNRDNIYNTANLFNMNSFNLYITDIIFNGYLIDYLLSNDLFEKGECFIKPLGFLADSQLTYLEKEYLLSFYKVLYYKIKQKFYAFDFDLIPNEKDYKIYLQIIENEQYITDTNKEFLI